MSTRASRREFLKSAGVAVAVGAAATTVGASPFGARLYPWTDLSEFDTPIRRRATMLRYACAAITWGGKDTDAIDDVSAEGYGGIQLRANAVATWESKPAELRDLLKTKRLAMPLFSGGNVNIDPAKEQSDLDTFGKTAAFLKQVGGLAIQGISTRPAGRAPTADDYKRMGALLTAIGKRTADSGIPLVYHPHMNSLSEKPEETAAVLGASDPRYVKTLIDTAHWKQGGGDPAAAITQYTDRIYCVHLKDVQPQVPPAGSTQNYKFVELGQGTVDFKAVYAALDRINFRGWAIVELDAVPVPNRTPRESADISKKFLEDVMHQKVGH